MSRIHRMRLGVGIALLGGVLVAGALAPVALAHAAAPRASSRPREFIAAADLAVVRLVSAYYAQTALGAAPSFTPLEPCTGLGTLVGTIGVGGNARSFVLTDAHVVSPVQPCASAQAAYLNMNHAAPLGWKLTKVTAYLNSSYTGSDAAQLGMLAFDLDISALPTLGLSDGPVVLPLSATTAPGFDLPVAVVPLTASGGATQALDLGNAAGTPYTTDAITLNELPGTLTVIETGAAVPPAASTPVPTPTALPATGTPVAATPTLPVISFTPAPAVAITPGAPIIADDGAGNGQVVGMLVTTPAGPRVVGSDALNAALHAAFVTSALGAFSAAWHSALDDYYLASPTNRHDPEYQAATAQFQSLQGHYPSFMGVTPWLTAAQSGSAIPGVVNAAGAGTSDELIPGLPVHGWTQLIALGVGILVVLVLLVAVVRGMAVRRRATRRTTGRPLYADDIDITQKTPAMTTKTTPRDAAPARPTIPLRENRRVVRYGLQAAGLTDPGVRRKADPNQDSILVVQGARMHERVPQPFGLFVVADGMGGHQFGREASSETVRVMADHILQPLLGGDPLDGDALLDLLCEGAQKANAALHYRNLRQHADMGTTVTAALVAGDTAYVINVGDSRTYHLQEGLPLRQVTADHSVVASLVAAGVIGPDDIYTHPKRNQIFRSLGEQEDAQIDTFTVAVRPGDHLLLCSDGLWEMIRNPRLETLLRHHRDLHTLTQALVDEANDNGGVDNVSAIVVRVLGEDAAPQQVGMHIVASSTTLKGL